MEFLGTGTGVTMQRNTIAVIAVIFSLGFLAGGCWWLFGREHLPPGPIYIGSSVWGDAEEVYSGCFLADGKTVALPNPDHGLIYFIDTSDARLVRALATPSPHVKQLAATPDGHQLACLQDQNRLVFFDLEHLDRRPLVLDLSDVTAHYELRLNPCMAISPDGREIAITACRMRVRAGGLEADGSQGVILFVDVATHRLVYTLEAPEWSVGALAFSPDGSRLAVRAVPGLWRSGEPQPFGKTILCDVSSHTLLKTIDHPFLGASDYGFTSDSATLAIHFPAHYLRGSPLLDSWMLYDAKTGEFLRKMEYQPLTTTRPAALTGSEPQHPVVYGRFKSGYLPIDLISSDGTREVRGGAREVIITNPTLCPSPEVELVFFSDHRDGHAAEGVNWLRFFRSQPSRYGCTYVVWDGSPGIAAFVHWNPLATGSPGPTRLQIERQDQPQAVDEALSKIPPPGPP